jgi:hypothetical protein
MSERIHPAKGDEHRTFAILAQQCRHVAKDVKKYYSKFDAAVVVELS